MALCMLAEDLEGGRNESDCAVRMLAHPAPGDEPAPLGDAVENVLSRRAVGQGDEPLRDRRQPVDARSALSRGLAGEIADHPGDLAERAGIGGERRDQTGTDGAASRTHLGDAERRVPRNIRRKPAAVVATDEHGLDGLAQAAGPVDDRTEWGPER